MISVILYGRNDSYGYNLHKRAALSFNCIAEVLDDESDEILFVDYNTPNDFPTFPEAIQDTLTPKAKRQLRILRVRPHIHEQYKTKTRLVALEPMSRNIAVRRSRPENRWILSTNTDMIFVPTRVGPLNESVRGLGPGFYHAPRIEIPETLWEGLDRGKPAAIIETVRHWGRSLYLNEIVKGSDAILYDGPGDFQLIERDVLFEIGAFHEEMILGWHVDSNIAKRLLLYYGKIGDLGSEVYGYHCDHTRQITPAHSPSRTQNDWRRFVDDVTRPDVPEQPGTWGCRDEDIEEIRLHDDTAKLYVSALVGAIGEPLRQPLAARYIGEEYNKTNYDSRHLLPFLIDLFVSSPKTATVAWFGRFGETLRLFAEVWSTLGFTKPILLDDRFASGSGEPMFAHVEPVRIADLVEQADAFVFDFGIPAAPGSALNVVELDPKTEALLRSALTRVVRAEHRRNREHGVLRQVIAINAINNVYEGLVTGVVAAGLTPYSTRMRHGFVMPPVVGKQNWTGSLQPGDAGILDGDGIRSDRNAVGVVSHGLYKPLLSGKYRLTFALSGTIPTGSLPEEVVGTFKFLSSDIFIDQKPMTWGDIQQGQLEVEIDVGQDDDERESPISLKAVILNWFPIDFRIGTITFEEIGTATLPALSEPRALLLPNWLSLSFLGPAGRRYRATGATAATASGKGSTFSPWPFFRSARKLRSGPIGTSAPPAGLSSDNPSAEPGMVVVGEASAGNVVFGPYVSLPMGHYTAVFSISSNAGDDKELGTVDVACNMLRLDDRDFRRSDLDKGPLEVDFMIGAVEASGLVEIRVWSTGTHGFEVRSITVRRGGKDRPEIRS